MTPSQLLILREVVEQSRFVIRMFYENFRLEMEFVDNGGNRFHRVYNPDGSFREVT